MNTFSRLPYLAILAAFHLPGFVAAQDAYPVRAVKVVVPFSAGSTADIIARVVSDRLSVRLKQPFIVDNRTGAGGSIGAGVVAKASPDGYTLLLTSSSPLTINPVLQKAIPFNVEKDFAPVGMIASIPVILVANPNFPAKSLSEMISLIRKNPGKYSYASNGQGSYAHITMEMFKQALGLDLTHVPYKGPAQAETDVVAGQVEFMFDGLATANPLIQGGRLRPFGVTSPKRSAFASEIPTFVEQNRPELKSFEVTSWVSILAPAGTPPAIVALLNAEVNEALKSTDFKAKLFAKSFTPFEPNNSKDILPAIQKEKARWAKVIKDGNIQPE
jgi:tripartite-type tricarboxylate transporter receptor subunit TctC